MPRTKVTFGALAAALSGLLVLELNNRLHANIGATEASYIATIFSFIGGYLARETNAAMAPITISAPPVTPVVPPAPPAAPPT